MGTAGCDDSMLEEEWGIIPTGIHDMYKTIKVFIFNHFYI
jgi:hypothetical protein